MKLIFKKAFALALALVLVMSAVPAVNAYADSLSDYAPVDVFYEKNGTSTYYTVQLGAAKNLTGCENCVNRMRDLGYNAFLYQGSNSEYYRLCVGVFDTSSEAKGLVETIQDLAPIKGTKAESAYATKIKLDYDAADTYCNYGYGGCDGYRDDCDEYPVDVFYQSDPDSDFTVKSVQVAASKNLTACENCVLRLREHGYNAFIYQTKGSSQYRICIGAFARKLQAQDLADEIRASGKVQGVKTESAYVVTVVFTIDGFDTYCDYVW